MQSYRAGARVPIAFLGVIFAVGLACRLPIFLQRHSEGDELLYQALVEQLETGQGYTLQGHPILEQPWVVGEQYDQPLFYHPPGAALLFWGFQRLAGEHGFVLAQLASYAVFFGTMMFLQSLVVAPRTQVAEVAGAALAAFTPIASHVTTRFWLDGPQLAFVVVSAALLLSSLGRRGYTRPVIAGALLAYATLIKMTAVLVIPGLFALAFVLGRERSLPVAELVKLGAVYLAAAVVAHLPWEAWLWHVTGSPLPGWSGRPHPKLVEINEFVRFLTVDRSPLAYLSLLPRVMWTIGPALVLLALLRSDPFVRGRAAALLLWAVTVLGVHIGFGAIGFSKLLRYVILVVPPLLLLYVLVLDRVWERLRDEQDIGRDRLTLRAGLALALVGLVLEIVQGVVTPFRFQEDLIVPLLGPLT